MDDDDHAAGNCHIRIVLSAVAEAAKKKEIPALARLRFQTFQEGMAAQIMYFGPYAEEGPTIARLHKFIEESGNVRDGKHHEIYLGAVSYTHLRAHETRH